MRDFLKSGGVQVRETRDFHDACFTLYVTDQQHRSEFAIVEVGSTIEEASKLGGDKCLQKGGGGPYSCNQVTKACDQSSLIAQSESQGPSSSATPAIKSDIIAALGKSRYGWQVVAVPESSGSALEKCASLSWTSCRRIGIVPPGACAAYAATPDGLTYFFGDGADLGDAKKSALTFCWPSDKNSKCEVRWSQCNVGAPTAFTTSSVDETYFATKQAAPQQSPPPLTQPTPPPQASSAPIVAQSTAPPPVNQRLSTPANTNANAIIEARNLLYLSAGIVVLLFMWLLWAVSIRTPFVILETYIVVALWTGLPLLLSFSMQARLGGGLFADLLPPLLIAYSPAFLELYGIVYFTMYIANRVRTWSLSQVTQRADHEFLRLPALTVTIPVALALYFSQHQFKQEVEFAICSLLALAIFGIGYFIRPYQIAAAPSPVETEPVQQPQAKAPAEVRSETTAVDAVPVNTLPLVVPQTPQVLQSMPPLEGVVLKLKRSQKTGTMGGIIYMLDARIDASQETLSLIAKHNLGSRLIYESEARQKHATAAQEHLAATRGGPSVFAPASEQAKGASGTIWKLGRAAVSAVRASLALRITVNSLLSGVHVECKSMEELLEAEAAIREAKENLEGFLETAQTFDGREEIS